MLLSCVVMWLGRWCVSLSSGRWGRVRMRCLVCNVSGLFCVVMFSVSVGWFSFMGCMFIRWWLLVSVMLGWLCSCVIRFLVRCVELFLMLVSCWFMVLRVCSY